MQMSDKLGAIGFWELSNVSCTADPTTRLQWILRMVIPDKFDVCYQRSYAVTDNIFKILNPRHLFIKAKCMYFYYSKHWDRHTLMVASEETHKWVESKQYLVPGKTVWRVDYD